MLNFSKNEVVLVRYPFTDARGSKVRPAVIINHPDRAMDVFIVPLTSRLLLLHPGEFVLRNWAGAGLNVETAAKRGLFTIEIGLVLRRIGVLDPTDAAQLGRALRQWLEI